MSRNRLAILADIEKYNLDPTVAHKVTHANGRLGKSPVVTQVETQVETKVEVQVAPPEEVVSSLVEELVPSDEVVAPNETSIVEDSTLASDEPKVEQTTKKKGKKSVTE